MLRLMGRSVGVACLALGIFLALTIAIGLILIQLFGEEPVIDELSCLLGLSEDCLRVELADKSDELDAAREQVAQLEDALSGRMVFTEGPHVAGVTVIVGTLYQDQTSRSDVIRAICWAIEDRGGLDPRLTLAEMDGTGAVRILPVYAAERSAIGIDAADIAAARGACPWPDAVQRTGMCRGNPASS